MTWQMGWRMLICIGYKYNLMVLLLPAGAGDIYTHMFVRLQEQQNSCTQFTEHRRGEGGGIGVWHVVFLFSLAILFRSVLFGSLELS